MNCLICGKPYALIRETELSTARISGRAHVDCNGHSKYMAVMPSEIEQQARWYEQARAVWNTDADEYNQWDDLGTDEKRELAVKVAIEEANKQLCRNALRGEEGCEQCTA